jgi:hypothetical protein
MFTFYRKFMYMQNEQTAESWYWTANNFKLRNRNLKYEYGDSKANMVIGEIFTRIAMFLILFLMFGMISIMNGLLFRVTIKCSSVVIVYCIMLEDICRQR